MSTLAGILVLMTSLAGCSQTNKSNDRVKSAESCDFGAVTITANFPTARMDECEKLNENEFSILLKPENRPINSSPWYAFKINAESPATVKIHMRVDGHKHRYLPKQSTSFRSWSLIDYKDEGEVRSFSVEVGKKPKYIAGQEILNNQFYIDWAEDLVTRHDLSYQLLGRSIERRPIHKLESQSENSTRWLVILGRMHPPEITGALALFPFVDTLLADNELANKFRHEFNILIIPNLNPDGVQAGNWRHNMNGVDLNRDWNDFKQPEVKAVHEYLKKIVSDGGRMSMAIDFHSTRRDIFYTMPSDYGVEQPYLVNNWLGALDNKYPNFKVIQQPGNNPDKGVFKQYFADQYGVHAITYEMGDNTDRDFIKVLAKDAAITLMKTMLQDNEELKGE